MLRDLSFVRVSSTPIIDKNWSCTTLNSFCKKKGPFTETNTSQCVSTLLLDRLDRRAPAVRHEFSTEAQLEMNDLASPSDYPRDHREITCRIISSPDRYDVVSGRGQTRRTENWCLRCVDVVCNSIVGN
jgi:hypothetical protein